MWSHHVENVSRRSAEGRPVAGLRRFNRRSAFQSQGEISTSAPAPESCWLCNTQRERHVPPASFSVSSYASLIPVLNRGGKDEEDLITQWDGLDQNHAIHHNMELGGARQSRSRISVV